MKTHRIIPLFLLLLACPLWADRVFDGTGDQIDGAFVITTTPFTLCAEARTDTVAVGDAVIVSINNTANNRGSFLDQDLDDSETVLRDATSGACATKTTTPVWNTTSYFRVCSIFTDGNTIAAGINGTWVSVGGAGCTVPAYNDLTIGVGNGGGAMVDFDGAISKVCVWNVALAQGELVGFFQGAGCQKIRPANRCVVDLHGNAQDVNCVGTLGTGWNATITGTTTQTARGGSKAK